NLLVKISEALLLAKDNEGLFGNINIIFAGDFAQISPVADPPLYASEHRIARNSCLVNAQQTSAGHLLWLSVDTVVMLTKIWRQEGDATFTDLLSRLREGRFISPSQPIEFDPNTPIIVESNALKDALNKRATLAYAKNTGQELHWYYANDSHKGQHITDPALQKKLETLTSSETEYRLTKIPLVIGMPVVVGLNFDVPGGVVNGT
ncbi:hypothetical protein DL96DRAFT_1480497, partial [Flagelloscypha sp. PMI_526]